MRLGAGDALILIDVQRDFMPGGSLTVNGADRVLAPINRCIALFSQLGLPIYASRDWHLKQHCSFREQGGPWPSHCVAGSEGAEFALGLHLPGHAAIVSKATRPVPDACSAFDGSGLAGILRSARVNRLFVAGVAADHGLQQTVTDGLAEALVVVVLRDAIAQLEHRAGELERGVARMRWLGAGFIDSQDLVGTQTTAC
jgi:nicotinamidase/pyrazinamidase